MTDYFSEFILDPRERVAFSSFSNITPSMAASTSYKHHAMWAAVALAVAYISWKISHHLTKNKLESGAQ
tara:strand:- start:623 stop:829 length:207 start_codon:yes stop_codon:yes gene_type:complete